MPRLSLWLSTRLTGHLTMPGSFNPQPNFPASSNRASGRDTTIPLDSNLVLEGDSITHGYPLGAGQDWGSVMASLPNFSGRVTKFNFATDGATISTLAARYVASVKPLRPAITGKPAILVVWVGTNDTRAGTAGSVTATAVGNYCTTARADGFQVWLGTTMDRADFDYLMRYQQAEFNRLVRDGSYWDKLLDFALIGSNSADTTFFADYAHPTIRGAQMLGAHGNFIAGLDSAPTIQNFAALNVSRLMTQDFQVGGNITLGKEAPIAGARVSLGASTSANKVCIYDDGTFHFGFGVLPNQGIVNTGTTNARTSWINATPQELMTLTGTGQLYINPPSTYAAPSASSLLQMDSTTQGFCPPRMTTTQRDAISSPIEGLVIYNTSTHKLNVRVAAAWEAITSA